MDAKTTAANLRKIASEIRERTNTTDQNTMAKSAQVLLAAGGLSRLTDVLRGEDDE